MTIPAAFGRAYRLLARSQTALIQADRTLPALAAADAYSAFLAGDSRISRRSVSPSSNGGLPLGRFMGFIMPVQITLDKQYGQVFNVRTVNQGYDMERHFYRCLDCLEVQAIDGPQLRGQWVDGMIRWPQCDCSGNLKWMGKVQGLSLIQAHLGCPCDGRCTGALGGNCDCSCGGKNHGTRRLVQMITNVGPIPKIAPRADLNERLVHVAEFKAAKEAALARIAAKFGERYQDYKAGQYIAGDTYWQIKETCTALHKASRCATHKGRMTALAKVAA